MCVCGLVSRNGKGDSVAKNDDDTYTDRCHVVVYNVYVQHNDFKII